jgi:hypothetical protein
MRVRGTGASIIVLGSLLSFFNPLIAQDASASAARERGAHHSPAAHHVAAGRAAHRSWAAVHHGSRPGMHRRLVASRWHHAVHVAGISCVPFARSDSGIAVSGNAWQWWDHAAGVYARGHLPELGSVLAFRSNPRMRLGHVAVVSQIINRREVEIDQANWSGPGAYGGVSRNVPVVDVSEANDWSAVRVGLGRSGDFGAVYPTYGFIYDRPDDGVMVAAAHAPAPEPELNPAPRDLRPAAERPWQTFEQVAEAPPTQVDPASQSQTAWNAGLSAGGGMVGAIDRK